LKKRKKKAQSSSLALADIGAKYRSKGYVGTGSKTPKKKSSTGHSRKRSNSIGHGPVKSKLNPDDLNVGKKRPLSAGGYIRNGTGNRRNHAQTMGFAPNSPKDRKRSSSKSKKKGKKNKDGKKKVSFRPMDEDKAPTRERKMKKKGKGKKGGKKKKLEDNPSLDSTRSDDSAISSGTVILHNGDTPKSTTSDGPGLSLHPNIMDLSYDASADIDSAAPTPQASRYDVMSTPICEDEEQDGMSMDPSMILGDDISIERMHSTDSRSVVIHDISPEQMGHHKAQISIGGASNASSSSFETSWHDDDEMKSPPIDMTKIEESSSSEITFSDDDNDDDDDNDGDGGTVPLSVQLLRAQEKKDKEKEDAANQPEKATEADKDKETTDDKPQQAKATEVVETVEKKKEKGGGKFAPPMPRLMSEISEE